MTGNTPATEGRRGLRQRLFAWVYARSSSSVEEEINDSYKREIFAGLRGDVLEIGPGIGDNLSFFPRGIRWIGIEPNLFMHPQLKETLQKSGVEGEIRARTAERIDLTDESVDGVVSTFVLCSVSDLDATLREIVRVLRPGGQFAFIEHVAAPQGTGLRSRQRWIKPVWKLAADGCHPDREIEAAIRRAGFTRVDVKPFRVPVPIVSPRIAGVAVK